MEQAKTTRTPAAEITTNDEIDLVELMRTIWRQRGLVVGCALLTLLAVLVFHLGKASFSTPERVDYSISLSFLSDEGHYPNGSPFSPRDLVASRVLDAVANKHSELSAADLAKAVRADYSNLLLDKSEARLGGYLADAKAPEDVRIAARTVLEDLRAQTRSAVTLKLDRSQVKLSAAQAQALLIDWVDVWAEQAISRGLMNVDISRPFAAFVLDGNDNLIDAFEGAAKYTDSLSGSIKQLEEMPGSQSLVVAGNTLSDIKRELDVLRTTDIDPLRSFAYSESAMLASTSPAVSIRLSARKRLLELEQTRLVSLIKSYDSSLTQLSQAERLDSPVRQTNETASPAIGSQMDQSFLGSLLELGSKLSNVEFREELFKKRTQAVEALLELEKEISVLTGSLERYQDVDAIGMLTYGLESIVPKINALQKQLGDFIEAYRQQSLQSVARVYAADSSPQIIGGGLVLAKKAGLTVALGLVLGLMLGVMAALVRAAMVNKN